MAKLQIRFVQSELDLIIEALNDMAIGGPYDDARDDAGRLASWLTWRRDKFYGRPAGGAEPARPPVAVTAIIEADGKDHGRTMVGSHEVTVRPQRAPRLSTGCG